MSPLDRIVRGILLGGSLGALCALAEIAPSMLIAVGVGAVAGFLAGLTRVLVDRRKGR